MSGEETADSEAAKNEKSKLGYAAILLITINSIMGTGIFFLPAVGAREAGLWSIVSWIVMGLVGIYFASIFGELVSRYPREGGVYEYAKEAFGQFPSFLLGWMSLIAAYVTIAMLIVGAIRYVGPILSNTAIIIISIIFIILFNLMAFAGLKTGAFMLVTFAFITLTALFGIMVPAFMDFNIANLSNWSSHPAFFQADSFAFFGVIFVTIFYIAETFFGWETTTFLAEQVRNPRKVMPKVLIIGTVIITVIVLLFVVASMSTIHFSVFGQSTTPLSDLATSLYGAEIGSYFAILVYLAIIGSVAGWIVAAPNLVVALAKDKMFLAQLADKHPKRKTPYKAIIFQTLVCSFLVFVGAGNYESLLHLLVPLVLILYAAVVVSLIVIRKKYPYAPTQYRAPGGKFGPYVLVFVSLALIIYWAVTASYAVSTLKLIFSFIFFSIPIYLLLIVYYNPAATIRFQNKTAKLFLFLERIFFPRWIEKELIANAIVSDKVVLELGASSGIMSRRIRKSRPKKHIIIEQSVGLKNILSSRMKNEINVHVLHDEHLTSRIHPSVLFVEEVFSFGILGNLHDEQRYLKQLAKIIPENGRIHFFDYVDMYKFIPNKEIFNDLDRLKALFREAGFAVTIKKHKGWLWNYLIIDGIRTRHTDSVYI
jgi:amino acid transporter